MGSEKYGPHMGVPGSSFKEEKKTSRSSKSVSLLSSETNKSVLVTSLSPPSAPWLPGFHHERQVSGASKGLYKSNRVPKAA